MAVEMEATGIPHFTHASRVHFDELDSWQMLHNARYGVHVERANTDWYFHMAGGEYGPGEDPDQFVFMREYSVEFKVPVIGPQTMWIDMWRIRWGRSSARYEFACRNEDGSVEFARGRRTIVKIDPSTGTATPWSERLRQKVAEEDALRAAAMAAGATRATNLEPDREVQVAHA
jgi:acyl-CoA thioester hydrolase